MRMTLKQILDLTIKEFEKLMSIDEYERMLSLGIQYTWQLLDMYKDSAKESGIKGSQKFVSIDEFLRDLEFKKEELI